MARNDTAYYESQQSVIVRAGIDAEETVGVTVALRCVEPRVRHVDPQQASDPQYVVENFFVGECRKEFDRHFFYILFGRSIADEIERRAVADAIENGGH